jgi:hypothetical protein
VDPKSPPPGALTSAPIDLGARRAGSRRFYGLADRIPDDPRRVPPKNRRSTTRTLSPAALRGALTVFQGFRARRAAQPPVHP